MVKILLLSMSFFSSYISFIYAAKVLENLNKRSLTRTQMMLITITHAMLFVILYEISKSLVLFYECIVSSLLLTMAYIDFKEKIVSDMSLIVMLILALIKVVFLHTYIDSIFASLIVSLPLLVVSAIYKGSIGSGDIYYLFILGLICGSYYIFRIVTFAYTLAFIYSIYLCISKKGNRKSEIPMLPFFYLSYLSYIVFTIS